MISKISLVFMGLVSTALSFFAPMQLSPAKSMRLSHRYVMSASENYLTKLQSQVYPVKQPENNAIKVYDELQLQNAEVFQNKNEVSIDTIYMNIYKFNDIFFNRNSKSVIFRLKNEMEDVFYCENGKMYRLGNTTRIMSKAFRKFIVAEMDSNIDAILYHQEKM